MKTTVSIKLDPEVKKEAAAIAQELGLSLSAIINGNLKQLIKTREVTFSTEHRMTPYLEGVIAEAEAEFKAGKTKSYKSFDALFADIEHASRNNKKIS